MICANCGEVLLGDPHEMRCSDGSPCYKAICRSCGYVTWMSTYEHSRLSPVYYVHRAGSGEPKHPHNDIVSAVKEAERICALNKQPVRVYQQVAVVNPVIKTEVKYG